MDSESKAYIQDIFLKPVADAHSTNARKEAPAQVIKSSHKTEMQLLTLKEESSNLITAMLKSIHGNEFEFGSLANYSDKSRSTIKKAYWKDRGELVVKGGNDSSYFSDRIKMYGLLKLESYGFAKSHCIEVLETFDNIDDCLNFLYDKYFPTKSKKESHDSDIKSHEVICDELESLLAIFPDEIEVVEKLSIWQFKVRLDYLLKFSPSEVKKKELRDKAEIEARFQELQQLKIKKKPKVEKCRNVLEKGKCKFGAKCKFSHDIYAEDAPAEPETLNKNHQIKKSTEDDKRIFILEIRFPKFIQYPKESPNILLRSKLPDISKSICLRINQRLIDESRELASQEMPSVYSVVDLLKNEEEILKFLSTAESFTAKYPPPEMSIFDYDPFHDEESSANEGEKMNLPTHNMLGKVDKFDKQLLSAEEILQEDMSLIRKFQENQRKNNYLKMIECRKKLPTWSKRDEIVDLINKNQVVIISGATGSGKSTQTPQFILDDWLEKSSKSSNTFRSVDIIVTQPRRIAAIGVAERISDERCEKVGGIVGYQIRLENKISTSTRLTFCTTGILLRRLYSDPLLKSTTHVILDEVHERSEESDFLLLILRELLQKRSDLKVILMSATLNAKLFSNYFNGAPVINIEGRTFPVKQIFLEEVIEKCSFVMEPDSQYCKKISKKDEADLMQELEYADIQPNINPPPRSIRDENLSLPDLLARYSHCSKTTCKTLFLMDQFKVNPELIESILNYIMECNEKDWPREGSVLIFLPGLGEIQSVYDALQDSKEFGARSGKYVLIPLHSTLSSEEQSLIFKKFNSKRKIILSTNIAETSITIDDVVFVIDCGQHKEKHFDNNRNMESLETVWISRANVSQRTGRAGRVMPGISFHLFTRHRFENHLLSQPVPEIHRIPLEQLLLRIKMLSNFNNQTIHDVLSRCIEPPSLESIQGGIKRLQNLGAFEGEKLTPLGTHIAQLPVDVRIGKLMLFGAIFQCLDSVLTICACLSYKSPFVSPFTKRQQADARKRQFSILNSDHLTVLNAYRKWKEACKRSIRAGQVYAEENYLSLKTLETIGEMKWQFLELLISIGFVSVDLPKKPRGKRFDDNILDITGKMLNANSDNSRMIAGLLCASLYPNIVKILTPEKNYVSTISGAMPRAFQASELKFKTKDDGYVSLHPSSVNSSVGSFNSPFLIFQEKVKTSRVFIRDCTMVPSIPLILFSGTDVKIELHNNEFLFLLEDGWLAIQADSLKVAECMKYLRIELMNILEEKIRDPLLNLWNHENGKKVISTIIHLLTKE